MAALLSPVMPTHYSLSHVIIAWAQVDVFLINEAFVMHHKTIEEHPSHSSELCHKVNYEVTFLDSRQGRPGVQALPDNYLPEMTQGLMQGDSLRPESDTQSLMLCVLNLEFSTVPFLPCHPVSAREGRKHKPGCLTNLDLKSVCL